MFNVLIMTWVVLSCQQRFPSSCSANEKQELDLSELAGYGWYCLLQN